MRKIEKHLVNFFFAALLSLGILSAGCVSASADGSARPRKERKIAVQTYTFHKNTLEETFKMLASAGITAAECYPEQPLSDKFPNATLMPPLAPEHLDFVKRLMSETGVKIISVGCIMKSPGDPKAFEKQVVDVCDMAKALGAERVETEAKFVEIPMWLKHTEARGLTIGVHHHAINAKGNQYYRPEALRDLADRFAIQTLPDVGHWARSGIEPLFGLKMLKGTFPFAIHFKDLDSKNKLNAKVVVFGTGALDAKAMLAELDAQGFDGYYIIENEDVSANPLPVVAADAEWLRNN